MTHEKWNAFLSTLLPDAAARGLVENVGLSVGHIGAGKFNRERLVARCQYCRDIAFLTSGPQSLRDLCLGYSTFNTGHKGDPAHGLFGHGTSVEALFGPRLVRIDDLHVAQGCQCSAENTGGITVFSQNAGDDNFQRHVTRRHFHHRVAEAVRFVLHRLRLLFRGRDHA